MNYIAAERPGKSAVDRNGAGAEPCYVINGRGRVRTQGDGAGERCIGALDMGVFPCNVQISGSN